jgi:hypothetical protein
MTNETETEQPISDPDVTLSYGESVVDGVLKIIVENLSVETSLLLDEDHSTGPNPVQVNLPDGEALAFAPVTFTNQHETEAIRVHTPNFTLAGSELRQKETRTIPHPTSDAGIDPGDLTRFDDHYFGWSTHGSKLGPGESADRIAMFEVPEGMTTEDVAVVYDSSTWHKYVGDLYGTTTARWTV